MAEAVSIASNRNDVWSVLTCAVCLNLYNEPAILPKCGHSFCFSCINLLVEAISGTSQTVKLACPECRQISSLYRNMTSIHPNAQLAKAVKFYLDVNPKQKIPALYPSKPCPHTEAVLNITKCSHCGHEFCNVCLFRHIEQVRFELTLANSGLVHRSEQTVNATLDENVVALKKSIEQQVDKVQSDVRACKEAFMANISRVINEYEKRASEQTRKLADEQLAVIDETVTSVKKMNGPGYEKLLEEINKVNSSSLLFCPAKKIIDLYDIIQQNDQQMCAAEKLFRNEFDPNITLKPTSVFKKKLEKLKKFEELVVQLNSKNLIEQHKHVSDIYRIHEAARKGDLATLQQILERSELSVACRRYAAEHHGECQSDEFRMSPLVEAAFNGHAHVVHYLATRQNVHAASHPDSEQFFSTAIQMAAGKGYLDIVKYLVDFVKARALGDSNTQCSNDNDRLNDKENIPSDAKSATRLSVPVLSKSWFDITAALYFAFCGNHISIVRYLLAQTTTSPDKIFSPDSGYELLNNVAKRGYTKAVEILIHEFKIPTNGILLIDIPRTPLHSAAAFGYFEIVQLLVEAGSEIGAKSKVKGDYGALPIHLAAENGHLDIVRYLLEQNAAEMIVAKTDQGKTTMKIAKENQQRRIVNFLEKKSVSLNFSAAAVEQPWAVDGQTSSNTANEDAGSDEEDTEGEEASGDDDSSVETNCYTQ